MTYKQKVDEKFWGKNGKIWGQLRLLAIFGTNPPPPVGSFPHFDQNGGPHFALPPPVELLTEKHRYDVICNDVICKMILLINFINLKCLFVI